MARGWLVVVGVGLAGCITLGDPVYDAELEIVVPQALRDATSREAPALVFGGADGHDELAGVLCGPDSDARYVVNVGGATSCAHAPKHLTAWIEPVHPDEVDGVCDDLDDLEELAVFELRSGQSTAYAEHHVEGCPKKARAELVLAPR